MLLMVSFGISLNNTLEAGKALFSNRSFAYVRTPKYAQLTSQAMWQTKKYQVKLEPVWMLELLFAAIGCMAIWLALIELNYSTLVILVIFTVSYAFISISTVLQSRSSIFRKLRLQSGKR